MGGWRFLILFTIISIVLEVTKTGTSIWLSAWAGDSTWVPWGEGDLWLHDGGGGGESLPAPSRSGREVWEVGLREVVACPIPCLAYCPSPAVCMGACAFALTLPPSPATLGS
jgi:hypothetical protein